MNMISKAMARPHGGAYWQRTSWKVEAIGVPLVVSLAPRFAYAQAVTGGADPATMLNNVCTFILGPFGQTLAVVGIIGIGLAWMFGRASMGLIAGVVGGIIIMFGASYLGQQLTGGAAG